MVTRFHQPLLGALDAWVADQPDPRPTRAEAIRRLLAEALGMTVGASAIEDLGGSNDG